MDKGKAVEHLLTRNVDEVIDRGHLEQTLRSGRKLRVKLGIDPTSPDLHLGHAVVLRKLAEFQNLGHRIVLIIGDFTGKIGDPSGRSEARKPLTDSEIKRNMKEYLSQAGKIIDVKKAEVRRNSEWFSKEGAKNVIELASAGSIQQMLRRADFKKRLESDQDITLLETLYPLFQGYDSVKVKADVELGGTDQKFNLLMGRRVQRHFKMKEQDVLMTPLLIGLDGEKKMSKSAKNYIGLTENAENMFGKIMSLRDALVPEYFSMCTELGERTIKELKGKLPPRDLKMRLGAEIVSLYHGESKARKARDNWEKIFSRREIVPGKLPELKLKSKKISVLDLVLAAKMVSSKSEARRLVMQGAVEINGEVKKNPNESLELKGGETAKVGKKNFFRIKI